MIRFLTFCCTIAVAMVATTLDRACFAESPPTATQLQQCLANLGNAKFQTRQRAVRELISYGPASLPVLSKAIDSTDTEVRARAVDVLLALADSEDPTTSKAARDSLRRLTGRRAERALLRQFYLDRQRLQEYGAKFTGLTKLELQNVELTPRVWDLVAEMKTVTTLQLGKNITDDDLKHLKTLADLRVLFLQDTMITDAGLVHLANLEKLETLNLHDTQVKGPGLRHLKNAVGITELDLRGPQTTNESLQHLKQFPLLETLYLARSQITDAGLAHLKAHPSLKVVSLAETKVTAGGVGQLRKDRADMRVYFD